MHGKTAVPLGHPRYRHRCLVVLAAVLGVLCLPSGCNRQPAGRYAVNGTVTFDGKPVPVGRVFLEPDPEAGNRGPQAIAPIRNGGFATQPRQGAVAGTVIIEVQGYDGVPSGSYPDGMPLFPPYRTKQELPKQSSTIAIDVPASAATAEFLKSIEKLNTAR